MPYDLRPRALVPVLVAALLATGCIGSSPTGQEIRGVGPRRAPDPLVARDGAAAINGFGADLQRAVAGTRSNVVVAPLAVACTLGMVRVGASGATRTQLDQVLHTSSVGGDLDGACNTLGQLLAAHLGDKRSERRKGRVELELATSLWGQRGTRFAETFLDALAGSYDRSMRAVDFRSDPESAREAINNWVRSETRGDVGQIVPRGDISQYTRFVATSATFLRAPWQVPFDAGRTRPAPFTLPDGSTVDVPTMQVSASSGLRYGTGVGWDAVELPYVGDELSLVVVRPTDGDVGDLVGRLDAAFVDRVTAALDERPLEVRLPTFQFTTEEDLAEPLVRIGAPAVFSERDAELPGITTDDALALSGFPYTGFFGIDEDGTAAPPGGGTVTGTAAPALASGQRVVVDRPFVFFVRDRSTGVLLLLGQVSKPR